MPVVSITATPVAPLPNSTQPVPLTPQTWRAPVAHGFGHQIPLSFAVRQIVPPRLGVAYANHVDPSALVDWKGGQPWNAALAQAVRPLGYRVWVSPTTVHIYE